MIIQSFQPSPKWLSGRPVQRPFRGLLSVHSRYGLNTRADTEFCDTLHRRLQPFRCLHSCSGCFRLERLPGGTFTHWDNATFSRRTPEADCRTGTDSPVNAGLFISEFGYNQSYSTGENGGPKGPSLLIQECSIQCNHGSKSGSLQLDIRECNRASIMVKAYTATITI